MWPMNFKAMTGLASLSVAALLLCAIRFRVCASAGLADDEAYYRLWSLAPALSYLDHPPMIAWIIAAGRWMAGDSPLGVRLCAPAVHLIGMLALWRTAALLYDRETARCAAWFLLAMPLLAVGGVIVTPDLPSVLFSGLVLWSLAEFYRSQNANWWLAAGLFAGFGLLSKYTNLFLGVTTLLWLVAVPGNRKCFRAPQLWIGGLLAAALASPVVIWNAQHQWSSFAKQFGRVAPSGGMSLHYLAEWAGGYLGLASPVIALLAIVGLMRTVRSAIASRDSADVLIVAAVLPMLGYFLTHALHDRVQANWLAPLYPVLAVCAAIGLKTAIPQGWQRTIAASAVSLGFLSIGAIYMHAVQPITAILMRKDPTAQMRGWAEFSEAADKLRRDSGAAWVATSSYATTGQLAFALKGRSEVAQLNERLRYAHLPPLANSFQLRPALYIELSRRSNVELLHQRFRRISQLVSLNRDDGSIDGATYSIYFVADPITPQRQPFGP